MENTYRLVFRDHTAWHQDAERMFISAGMLWLAVEDSNEDEIMSRLGYPEKRGIKSSCTRNYCLLLGLSYELLFKSIIVLKNGSGNVSRIHDLVELAKTCKYALNEKETQLFMLLSHYILWAGKYPEPKTVDQSDDFQKVFSKTVVKRFHKGNVYTSVYNGALEWDVNKELWEKINDIYICLTN